MENSKLNQWAAFEVSNADKLKGGKRRKKKKKKPMRKASSEWGG